LPLLRPHFSFCLLGCTGCTLQNTSPQPHPHPIQTHPGRDGGGEAGWESGLFDRGSWVEAQAGWARSVVTGRARLNGVPVGVIAVETQTQMRHVPADPGDPASAEQDIPQAGQVGFFLGLSAVRLLGFVGLRCMLVTQRCLHHIATHEAINRPNAQHQSIRNPRSTPPIPTQVWWPDSADKTAQAIEEFDREGLPLFILANWRGFAGGQRDLFEGVLQAGSLIVEQLRVYHQPVFVYIPGGGELRGGAWVVVDAQVGRFLVLFLLVVAIALVAAGRNP
jgi:acetyl-CoA carboxylase carboxyltransferase component